MTETNGPGRRALLAGAAGLAALGAGPALAQRRYPDHAIRMLIPYSPGGTTDVLMRAICDQASRRFGQTVVPENRAGAGGILGAQALATDTRADGYLLSQMPISVIRYPLMAPRRVFDPMADFTWIIQLTGYLFGVAVKADAPWKTFPEFLDYAKANPGKVNYGTPGTGTSLHLTMEQIATERGIEWAQVPFGGAAENLQALLGGQIHAMADTSTWAELVLSGQLRLLTVWSGERAKRFPQVPTLREVGIDIVSESPYGLGGPKNMSPEVVKIIHDTFREALFDPTNVAALDRYDMAPAYLDSADYAAAMRRQYQQDSEMLGKLGLRRSG